MNAANGLPRCIILGGGGHAAVVIECLLLSGRAQPTVVLDANPRLTGTDVLGIPIAGSDGRLGEFAGEAECFAVGVGSVGDNQLRARLFDLGLACGLEPAVVRHPTAIVSPSAQFGPGCQFLAGCIVNARAVLGANVLANSGAIVEHDCVVGDHAHIGPGACLGGGVRLGARVFLGAGSCVRQGLAIGENVIVGAGAVVVKNVPSFLTVAGNPAVPLARKKC